MQNQLPTPRSARGISDVQSQNLELNKSVENFDENEVLKPIKVEAKGIEISEELSLEQFFKKLTKINKTSPMPTPSNEFVVNKYSKPRGLHKNERI